MLKNAILLLALYSGFIATAQNATKETIQWNATGFKDLDANADFANSCQFITYGTQKIKWVQDTGKSVVELTVTNTIGTWADVNKSGSITYKITDGTAKGDLILKKSVDGWLIDLTLLGGTSDIRLRYTVSSIQKL
ncbi:MAG: hypothetical protein ABL895_07855 [Cyclobacteriaceae bacterium]